jgi:hypothetical protein
MIRVLVVAERSLLADLIVSSLAPEADLKVLRLTKPDPNMVSQAIREDCPVLILVEEGQSKDTFLIDNDLFSDCSCFRMITVSPDKHYLRICDHYELPLAEMTQVIDLAKNFSREILSEATC